VVSSGKMLYLGYHDDESNPTNGDSSLKEKSSSDSKPSTGRSGSTSLDNDSTEKEEKASSAKLDRADSTNEDSSSKENSSSDSKPPTSRIRITAPDNDASSKKEKKTTSSTTLDRIDSASDDDNTKPSLYSTLGSISDGSSASKQKNISTKVDITPPNDDNNSKEKKRNFNTELSSYDTRGSTAKDDGSIGKKKTTDVTKSDKTYSASDDGEDSEDKKNKNTDTNKLYATPIMNVQSSPPDMTSSTFNPEPSNHHTKDSTRLTPL
jgi:hypothetical protein